MGLGHHLGGPGRVWPQVKMGDSRCERDSGTRAAHRVVQRGEKESRRRRPTRSVAGLGRKEALLARRRELQIRTLVARRVHYRKTAGTTENAGAGTPEAYLNSPPDLCH